MANDFFQDVWDVVRLIPEGRVTSYEAIAKYLGSVRSSRIVGWAINASHSSTEPVPAYRVVNRLRILSGKTHFPNPEEMQRKLEVDGVRVENDRVVEFNVLQWSPRKNKSFE